MTRFIDNLKQLLRSKDDRQPSTTKAGRKGFRAEGQPSATSSGDSYTQGKSGPPSLGQHPLSSVSASTDAPASCPNAISDTLPSTHSSKGLNSSGFLNRQRSAGLSSPSKQRSSNLRQSLDTATSSKVKKQDSQVPERARVRSTASGQGLLDSESITKALDPSLSAKIKNMVFVEVPVCVDHSEGSQEQQHHAQGYQMQQLQQQQQQQLLQSKRESYADSKGDSKDFTTMMSQAVGPGGGPYAEQAHPKVQRMRSLPMMLDTSLQHPGALQAQVRAEGKGGASRQPNEVTKASDGEVRQPEDTWAQVERSLLPTKRHTSLKMLLHLDNYDFFSDVNVAEAQDAMGASEPSPSGTSQFNPQGNENTGSKDMQPLKESNILAVSEALPRGMRRPGWSLNDFTIIKKLHQGYASNVYFARCQYTQNLVVLKVYRLNDQGDLERVQLYREIRVHSKLQHQNIAQFYAAFLERRCVIIVQEYAAGGDLLRFMYKCGGRLSERQAVNLVLQPFLSALLHLHSQGIIHRDIKPENCLLTDMRVLKLADFGLAVDLREERANTRAGTLEYMPPEVLRCPTKKTPDQYKQTPGGQHYEMGADAWAVGAFAYELIVGTAPFKAASGEMIDTARNIIAVNVTYPASISEMARSFISSCLRKHSGDRPTVVEMLQHPWIRMFQRRSSVHMPGEVAHSPLSAQDLQNQVAMGGARGIGVPPALPSMTHRTMGASWGPSTAAVPSGHAHHHHHHHHHHSQKPQ